MLFGWYTWQRGKRTDCIGSSFIEMSSSKMPWTKRSSMPFACSGLGQGMRTLYKVWLGSRYASTGWTETACLSGVFFTEGMRPVDMHLGASRRCLVDADPKHGRESTGGVYKPQRLEGLQGPGQHAWDHIGGHGRESRNCFSRAYLQDPMPGSPA